MSTQIGALHNGAVPGAELALSRGLHYGDGVFRTLLRYGDAFVDWDLQLAKLARDAAALDLAMPPAELLAAEAAGLFGGMHAGVFKILLWRSGASRGYRGETSASERLLLSYPLPVFAPASWTEGIRAFVCSSRLASQPLLAGLKHLNRLEQVLASRGWPANAQEGILRSADGAPVCGTRSNLFWIKDDRLHTPDLREAGVAGRMRERVLAAAQARGLETRIGVFAWEELLQADEVFITNSLIGLWPVSRLEEREWVAPGVHALELMRSLGHPLIQFHQLESLK